MKTTDIHINIGSNSGHRQALIEQAVAAVLSAFGGEVSRSDIIETPPWGFDSPNPFLNIGLRVRVAAAEPAGVRTEEPGREFALGVLRKLQEIQRSIDPSPHRDASGGYIDRKIDIDLIAIDGLVVDTPELTLPHPRMHLRDFVLLPLAQLAPGWIHPLLHKSVGRLVSELDMA